MASKFMFTDAPERGTVASGLRVLTGLLVTLGLMMALLYSGYMEYTSFEPATDGPSPPPARQLEVDSSGRRVTYADAWMAREGRLWQRTLQGSPEQIGAAAGALTGRLYQDIDRHLTDAVGRRFGEGIEAWAEHMRLRWDYRATSAALREVDRRELLSMLTTLPPLDGEGLSAYERLHLMQCVVDVARRLDDVLTEGLVFVGVPSSSRGQASQGSVIVGRSFTVDLDDKFDADRIVTFTYPDGRYPFVSVGWAGLVGVVTGVNARGVFVAVNAAQTDESPENGLASTVAARQLLEEADSLDRALELLDEMTLRSPTIFTIADGFSRKAIVVEAGPGTREDRRVARGEGDPVVWATNHMTRDIFERDAHNERVARTTSSGQRYARLEELLPRGGNLTVRGAVEILRDRRGLNDAPLGLANHGAIEHLSTTHAMVVDLTAMVMWVSEGPSALGRFQAFDLRRQLGRRDGPPAPLDDIAADPLLYSEAYHDLATARAEIEHARALLRAGQRSQALSSAKIALALAPDLGELHRLLGDIERELSHREAAIGHYRRYLELVPGKEREQEVVRGIIQELGG